MLGARSLRARQTIHVCLHVALHSLTHLHALTLDALAVSKGEVLGWCFVPVFLFKRALLSRSECALLEIAT